MTNQAQDNRPHFVLTNTSEAKPFTAHGGGGAQPVPELPRAQHGASLQAQLQTLRPMAENAASSQQDIGLESGIGLQIQFQSQPGVVLAFESLANETQHIELLSIRQEEEYTYANVFVPDGKLEHFEKYVTEYLAERKDKNGKPLDHRALLDTIETIRAAELRALWTDDPALLPQNPDESFWWEVWLPERGNRELVIEDFRKLASAVGCTVSENRVDFPERTVVMMHGSERQFSQTAMTLNCVAELRRAKETAELFDGMDTDEQQAWKDELLARTTFPTHTDDVPRVCLLDSGVNRGHPLLSPTLTSTDMHTVEQEWGKDDECNHGTGLGGIAVYGDLTDALATEMPIQISHLLESVKLTRGEGDNPGNNEFHANLFAKAVSHPEIAAPQRMRVFSSAVTATDFRDRGRPSSWSAMVDSLAADVLGGGQFPRLIVQSAGNTKEHHAWITYPDSLSTNLIHDPGQAWNSLTVGAFTEKVETEEASIAPVAPSGGLSPFTTTSAAWDKAWPLKPDVVFEGGNVGQSDGFAGTLPSLNLLTTHFKHTERLFTTTNATSAASALCSRMAAQLMATYPQLRPETIRALIVHSAEWTEAMREQYLPADKPHTKNDYTDLIRHCGWGVPDLDRALWSAANSLTLIVEDKVHPYKKDGCTIKTRDMNLHALPWPKDELEALGETQVQMRVTLSYFIEPNPSARGSASKYHYPSHRLRFDVRHHLESEEDFLARINAAAALEEDNHHTNPKDPDWRLGERRRHKGSLHQDIWEGSAADLASRGHLAIYPSLGWWRTRPKLERYNLPAHYTLIISIRAPETEIDLYNAVAAKIQTPVVIST
ncbi:MAG: S8 family peptidase [Gallionella sp.]|nr:S8 family peptidase [Gallionella sp.]MDD4945888.1 S8 family peptidase [Gallionella sp.]